MGNAASGVVSQTERQCNNVLDSAFPPVTPDDHVIAISEKEAEERRAAREQKKRQKERRQRRAAKLKAKAAGIAYDKSGESSSSSDEQDTAPKVVTIKEIGRDVAKEEAPLSDSESEREDTHSKKKLAKLAQHVGNRAFIIAEEERRDYKRRHLKMLQEINAEQEKIEEEEKILEANKKTCSERFTGPIVVLFLCGMIALGLVLLVG